METLKKTFQEVTFRARKKNKRTHSEQTSYILENGTF